MAKQAAWLRIKPQFGSQKIPKDLTRMNCLLLGFNRGKIPCSIRELTFAQVPLEVVQKIVEEQNAVGRYKRSGTTARSRNTERKSLREEATNHNSAAHAVPEGDNKLIMSPRIKMPKAKSPSRRDAGSMRKPFLDSAGVARKVKEFQKGDVVYAQGDAATSIIYLQAGNIRLSVVNESGKEAVVAVLGPGDFFGEGSLAGQSVRMGTARAVVPSTTLVIEKKEMFKALHEQHGLSDRFIAFPCWPGT